MLTPKIFHPTPSKYLVLTTDYLIPFFVSLAGIVLIYLVLFSSYFQVSQITCMLDFVPCNDPAVLSEIDKLKSRNIFRLTQDELSARLTSGDFTIAQVSIRKTLPSTLAVSLISVRPVVAISVTGNPTWVVLDEKYRVIGERSNDPNVPTVIISSPIKLTIGKPIEDKSVTAALRLALRLAQEIVSIKNLTLVDDNTITIQLSTGPTAIFSPRLDEITQLKTLQSVLSDATIWKGVSTIDVRFNRPVLR